MFFFFFTDTATTEIYTLSLHDALPICDVAGLREPAGRGWTAGMKVVCAECKDLLGRGGYRSEEHTSELQSPDHLVCRLLLEKKKNSAASQPRCTRRR